MEQLFLLHVQTKELNKQKEALEQETSTCLDVNSLDANPLVPTVAQYLFHLLRRRKCCLKAQTSLTAIQIKQQVLFTSEAVEIALFGKYAALAVARQKRINNIYLITSIAQKILHTRTRLMIPQ